MLACIMNGQVKTIKIKKSPVDTIDYTYLLSFDGYTLKKVTENGMTLQHSCSKTLMFRSPVVMSLRGFRDSDTNRVKYTDTIINTDWYLIKNVGCMIYNEHSDLWLLKLNTKSNILIATRSLEFPRSQNGSKSKTSKKLLFRVIKFSESEVILEDLQTKPWHWYYYFQKRIPTR